MLTIERRSRADRQADAVNRQRIEFAQRAELRMRRSAGAHVVLRVHLEEADRLRRGEDVAKMRRLETDAGARRKTGHDRHVGSLFARRNGKRAYGACATRAGQDLIGSSEPMPLGVFMFAHVPFGTYFQALPW